MRNLGTRIFAFLLVVWYSLGVIGFGVHTCSESNRRFITNFISGVSCEDIHPMDVCKASCCSSHKHKNCCSHHLSDEAEKEVPAGYVKFSNKACCSNDYQQIELTGSGQDSASEQSVNLVPLYSIYIASSYSDKCLSCSNVIKARALPDTHQPTGELRPLLSVWRI